MICLRARNLRADQLEQEQGTRCILERYTIGWQQQLVVHEAVLIENRSTGSDVWKPLMLNWTALLARTQFFYRDLIFRLAADHIPGRLLSYRNI